MKNRVAEGVASEPHDTTWEQPGDGTMKNDLKSLSNDGAFRLNMASLHAVFSFEKIEKHFLTEN